MSLADEVRECIYGTGRVDVIVDRVRELERSHAEAVGLLRLAAYGMLRKRQALAYLVDRNRRIGAGDVPGLSVPTPAPGIRDLSPEDMAVAKARTSPSPRPVEAADHDQLPGTTDPTRPVEAAPVCADWCGESWKSHPPHSDTRFMHDGTCWCSPACRDLGRPVRPGKGTL